MIKRRHQLLLIIVLTISSFLYGFTYKDLESGAGIRGAVATLETLPSRLLTAINANLGKDALQLSPVETYSTVFSYLSANYYGNPKPDETQLT